jgi:hypothetical protein
MLVRDPYSGYLHEVPAYGGYSDYGYAEPPLEEGPDLSEYDMGEVVYDGLGNPVGLLPALLPLIASALPAISSAIPKIASVVSNLIRRALRTARVWSRSWFAHRRSQTEKEEIPCWLKTVERDTCTSCPGSHHRCK